VNKPKIKYCICVVLYKKKLEESDTISSISKCLSANSFEGREFEVIIYNNGSGCSGSIDIYHGGFKYNLVNIENNISLASIYNIHVSNNLGFDYYCFFDDDTELNVAYFQSLIEINGFCAVPKIIEKKDDVYSPRFQPLVTNLFNRRLINKISSNTVGSCSSINFFAVLSGLAVSAQAFERGVAFDESFDFYGVDSKFFYDYAKAFDSVYILDCQLNHKLSYFQRRSDDPLYVWRVLNRISATRKLYKYLSSVAVFLNEIAIFLKLVKIAISTKRVSLLRAITYD
jgi:hypothetical protein